MSDYSAQYTMRHLGTVHQDFAKTTVALEIEDQMLETMIDDRNLPNLHLFGPFFCTYT